MEFVDQHVEHRTTVTSQCQHQADDVIRRPVDEHVYSAINDEIHIQLGLKAQSVIHGVIETLIKSGQHRPSDAGGRAVTLAGSPPEMELLRITTSSDGGFRIRISPGVSTQPFQVLTKAVSNPRVETEVSQLETLIDQPRPKPTRAAKPRKVPMGRRHMFSPATAETPASWRLERPWHAEAIRLRDQGMTRLAIAQQLGVSPSSLNYFLSNTIRATRRRRTEAQWQEKRGQSSRPGDDFRLATTPIPP